MCYELTILVLWGGYFPDLQIKENEAKKVNKCAWRGKRWSQPSEQLGAAPKLLWNSTFPRERVSVSFNQRSRTSNTCMWPTQTFCGPPAGHHLAPLLQIIDTVFIQSGHNLAYLPILECLFYQRKMHYSICMWSLLGESFSNICYVSGTILRYLHKFYCLIFITHLWAKLYHEFLLTNWGTKGN